MLSLGPIRRGWQPPWVLWSLPHYDSWLAGRRGKFKSALIQTLRKWNRGSRVEKKTQWETEKKCGGIQWICRMPEKAFSGLSEQYIYSNFCLAQWLRFSIFFFFQSVFIFLLSLHFFVEKIVINNNLVPLIVNTTFFWLAKALSDKRGKLNLLSRDWAWGDPKWIVKASLWWRFCTGPNNC